MCAHRGDVVSIEGGDAHHVTDVLRLGSGDRIEVIDSAAQAFVAELERDGRRLHARLVDELARAPAPDLRIDVAQALPKGSKMDFVVEKATELGASAILTFCSERTIARGVRRFEAGALASHRTRRRGAVRAHGDSSCAERR